MQAQNRMLQTLSKTTFCSPFISMAKIHFSNFSSQCSMYVLLLQHFSCSLPLYPHAYIHTKNVLPLPASTVLNTKKMLFSLPTWASDAHIPSDHCPSPLTVYIIAINLISDHCPSPLTVYIIVINLTSPGKQWYECT